jgi:hypothetical protein
VLLISVFLGALGVLAGHLRTLYGGVAALEEVVGLAESAVESAVAAAD